MSEGWDNLFWQLPSGESSTQREVNTTKNLVKVLQDTEPQVEKRFVQLLWDATKAGDVPSIERVSYEREYTGDDHATADELFLIGISRKGRAVPKVELSEVTTDGGQPDASIVADTPAGRYQYLLEVKTGKDQLGKTQLGKYCNEFGVPVENVTTIQWSAIEELSSAVSTATSHELSSYLLEEFSTYLQLQGLDEKVALFRHDGYEKSLAVKLDGEDVSVAFHVREDGSSDMKVLSSEQFVDLFEELFETLGLDRGDRRRIFIDGNQERFSTAVAQVSEKEVVAATDIGFSGKARYQLVIDSHGSDAGLLKLQEMGEDGRFAEFPNTYYIMLTEWELLQVVTPGVDPGFTDETLRALFVDLQPSDAI